MVILLVLIFIYTHRHMSTMQLTWESYCFSLISAHSLRIISPMYSITIVCFSKSRAANKPRPYKCKEPQMLFYSYISILSKTYIAKVGILQNVIKLAIVKLMKINNLQFFHIIINSVCLTNCILF